MAKRQSKGWPRIGSIVPKKDDPKSMYLRVSTRVVFPDLGVELEEGSIINMQKPKDELNRAVEQGRMTEEEADEMFEKIGFVKYNLYVAPSSNGSSKAKSKSKKQVEEDDEF